MNRVRVLFASLVLLALLSPAVSATNYTWVGAGCGGNTATDPADNTTWWNNPANWKTGIVPGSADTAYLTLTNASYVTAQTTTISSITLWNCVAGSALHVSDPVQLQAANLTLSGGPATVIQDGGSVSLSSNLAVTESATYRLSAGSLSTPNSSISGDMVQTGGTHTTQLVVNGDTHQSTYQLDNGELNSTRVQIGIVGYKGKFIQKGGTHEVIDFLNMGSYSGGASSERAALGEYSLEGGTLHVKPGTYPAVEIMGWDSSPNGCTGIFRQSGGVHVLDGEMQIGYKGNSAYSRGLYELSGGALDSQCVLVGSAATRGTLSITNPIAQMIVRQSLNVGKKGILNAVPGTAIHMTGANFINQSDNEAALAGLANLKMIFEGGPTQNDTFEVAGTDHGRTLAGYALNFALGTLAVGSLDNIGILRLVDDCDSLNRGGIGGASEALYASKLTLAAGSSLDLNGLHLYVRELEDTGGTITGGSLVSLIGGDANGDFCVDGGDLALWQQNYDPLGLNANTFAMGDWNGDGAIDGGDLALWQQNYSPLGFFTSSVGGVEMMAAVPEPGTLMLLGAGALGLAMRRRRRRGQ